jgi:hypothetical protein
MKLLLETQYMENYGDEERPYWKMKGGYEYIVPNIPTHNLTQEFVSKVANAAMMKIQKVSSICEEWVTNWEVIGDNEYEPYIEGIEPEIIEINFTHIGG